MIVDVQFTVQCDEPGCEDRVTFPNLPGGTIMGSLRERGWQPWDAKDYCPEHRKEDK